MDFKTKTLVDDYQWIWHMDPALDADCKNAEGEPDFAARYERYQETGDESHLPIRDGVEVNRWTLRHLRQRELRRVQAESQREKGATPTALAMAAAYVIVAFNGDEFPRIPDPHGTGTVLDPDILDNIDAGLKGFVNALGWEAIRRAELPPK